MIVSLQASAAVAAMQQTLAEMLRRERRQRRLTQADVAQLAGVSRPTVIAVEAGHGIASQNLVAIMVALGITFAKQEANPVPQRPRLKALMQAERERQAMLRARHVAEGPPPAAFRFQSSPEQAKPPAAASSRPRMREMMAQERARRAQRPRG